jgi:cyanophycinase
VSKKRGFIVPIGGAEEKISDATILRKFADIAGGREARIVVIPTASQLEDTGRRYEKIFEEFRVKDVRSLRFETRADGEREAWLDAIWAATGVFMTGGNQLRLSTILGGTPLTELLRQRNAEGLHIAGTSAGAAFVAEHMIASGEPGRTPRADMVQLSPGLGLTNRILVDQHFRQRGRLGRLMAALSYNPRLIGIGLDEDTAAFLGPDDILEVWGSGAVTILDASSLEYSSMHDADENGPVSVIGMRMHVLVQGGTFDLVTRHAQAAEQVKLAAEAAEDDF